MNLVSYKSYYDERDSKDVCGICLDSFNIKNRRVIAHNNISANGQQCPIHERCLKIWIERHPKCPICRAEVNMNSVLSLKDRFYRKIYEIKRKINVPSVKYPIIVAGLIGVTIGLVEETLPRAVLIGVASSAGLAGGLVGGIIGVKSLLLLEDPIRETRLGRAVINSGMGGLVGIAFLVNSAIAGIMLGSSTAALAAYPLMGKEIVSITAKGAAISFTVGTLLMSGSLFMRLYRMI